jgi:hypothetical protein
MCLMISSIRQKSDCNQCVIVYLTVDLAVYRKIESKYYINRNMLFAESESSSGTIFPRISLIFLTF